MIPANDQTYWGIAGHALALQNNPFAGSTPGGPLSACDDSALTYGGGSEPQHAPAAALSSSSASLFHVQKVTQS